MTKELLQNGDIYWLDSNGNSIVIMPNGKVYLETYAGDVVFLSDNISNIENEEGDFIMDGVSISEYIKKLDAKSTEVTNHTTASSVNSQTINHVQEMPVTAVFLSNTNTVTEVHNN